MASGTTPSSAVGEVAIGLGSYAAYLAVRRSVWTDEGRRQAQRNAERVLEVERTAGLHLEPAVQRIFMQHPRLIDVLNVGYAAGNLGLSVGWLLKLRWCGDPRFRRERRAAVAAMLGALPVFAAFPVAPPRVREDVVDTLGERGVDIEHPFLVRFYNPIAAMPSQHVAFAVVSGAGLARTRRGVRRRLWQSYPLAVTAVVVGTGNHFVLDAIAGAVLGAAARVLAR